MGLGGLEALEWEHIRGEMRLTSICSGDEGDQIGWLGRMKRDDLSIADYWKSICCIDHNIFEVWWFYKLWKTKFPIKIILFIWLVWTNKNLTWENIQKRNWQGPSICVFCRKEVEDNVHLFLKCPIALQIYMEIVGCINFPIDFFDNITDCLTWWSKKSS